MSILDRLNLLIRSEISEVSRGGKLKSALGEMESSLRDAKRQEIELRQGEKRLILQIRESREKANRWEERAILALKSGDEELAREALVMKNKTLAESGRLRDQLDEQRAYMKDISSALQALDMKMQGTRARSESSSYRPTTSSQRGSIRDESDWDSEMKRRMGKQGSSQPRGNYEGSTDFSTDRSMKDFDRMADKISSLEANVDAYDELSGHDDLIDPRKRELEQIFDKMERTKKTSDDLADLKNKFSD